MDSEVQWRNTRYDTFTPFALKPDFSNEVHSNKNGADFDVSLSPFWERRPDSLYHYANGRLNPRFTMNFAKKEIPIHDYKEFPHHFLGSIHRKTIG